MASGAIVSGLDRLVEAVEAAERAAERAAAARTPPRQVPGGFECPHPGCKRVFSKRYNQQAHMRLHDGTRPFACHLCGKAFMWKSSLKSHAKMHAKMSAAQAGLHRASQSPSSNHTAAQSAARVASPRPSVLKARHAVSKRRSKSSSPSRRRSGTKKKPAADSRAALVEPKVVPAVPSVPLQLPATSDKTLPDKTATGRNSPSSISMMDHDAATVLTMFR